MSLFGVKSLQFIHTDSDRRGREKGKELVGEEGAEKGRRRRQKE